MSSLIQTQNSNKINSQITQNNVNTDFNYPSLNRKDLMYLSTMTCNDFPLKKFKQLHTNRNWSINLYNLDIEGSSPRRFGAFNQKIDYINKNDDIEKSSPKKLHKPLKKPEYNLTNADIEYSQPNCVTCKIKRHLNPLEPKYKLPKRKPYIRKTKYEFMDYRDVTDVEFRTNRNTNPLNPFYTMNFVDGTKIKFGPIEKNKPLVGSSYMYKVPLNLKVDDIEGSNIGSKNKYKKFKGNNYCYNITDIVGAQSGTLLKGISTKRMTNPLWPKYKYLGEEELKGYYENNPYNNYNTVSSFNRSKSMSNKIYDNTKKNDNENKNENIIEIINPSNEKNEKILSKNNGKNEEKEKISMVEAKKIQILKIFHM